MAEKAEKRKTSCVTPTGRVSYPSVFKTKEQMTPGTFKYELTLLFPKKTTNLSELRQVLDNACIDRWGPDKKKWPQFAHPAIKDGDEKEDQEAYHGHWYITPKANPDRRPQVLDQKKNPISETDNTFYGGCYAKALVNAYAYPKPGVKMAPGVTFGLNAVQKVADGERFGGSVDVDSAFDEIEDGAEDATNYAGGDSNSDDDEDGMEAFQ